MGIHCQHPSDGSICHPSDRGALGRASNEKCECAQKHVFRKGADQTAKIAEESIQGNAGTYLRVLQKHSWEVAVLMKCVASKRIFYKSKNDIFGAVTAGFVVLCINTIHGANNDEAICTHVDSACELSGSSDRGGRVCFLLPSGAKSKP